MHTISIYTHNNCCSQLHKQSPNYLKVVGTEWIKMFLGIKNAQGFSILDSSHLDPL